MEENRTVICKNSICRKEYSILFDKCPFCGADRPDINTKRHPLKNEQITCPKCGEKYRNNKESKCPFCGEETPEWIEGKATIAPLPLTTTNGYGENKYIELGIVTGCTVMSKHFIADAFAGLKSIVGGEIKAYTKMLEDARAEATERMIKQANDLDADAVIGIRFETSAIIDATEIMCYGTAIKISNN